MAALRKMSDRSDCKFDRQGLVVDYSEDVTKEQVRQIDELVQKEFDSGNWVTVEQES
jgi:hypothetical protein